MVHIDSMVGSVGTSWSVVKNAFHKDGFHTLWRGVEITMLRDGVGVAFFFTAMATSQDYLGKLFFSGAKGEDDEKIARHQSSLAITVASGGFAGLAYWIVSLPLDTIKTWIQTTDSSTRLSAVRVIKDIYSDSGLFGLFFRLNRGWQVAYGRGIPSAAMTVAVYSYAYETLQSYENTKQL